MYNIIASEPSDPFKKKKERNVDPVTIHFPRVTLIGSLRLVTPARKHTQACVTHQFD